MNFQEKLAEFEETFQSKSISLKNSTIEYATSPGKGTCIFCLPGGVGHYASFFHLLLDLSLDYRVVSLNYPGRSTMRSNCELIREVMEAEQIEKAVFFGQSFGGGLAQVFADLYPAQVEGLILSHTFTTQDHFQPGLVSKIFRTVLKILPIGIFRTLVKRNIEKEGIILDDNAQEWREHLKSLIDLKSETKEILFLLDCIHDLKQNYSWTSRDFADLDQKTALLYCLHDPKCSKEEIARIRHIFAELSVLIHEFEYCGHMAIYKESEIFLQKVREALKLILKNDPE